MSRVRDLLSRLARCGVQVTPSGKRCMFFRFHRGCHYWTDGDGRCALGVGWPDGRAGNVTSEYDLPEPRQPRHTERTYYQIQYLDGFGKWRDRGNGTSVRLVEAKLKLNVIRERAEGNVAGNLRIAQVHEVCDRIYTVLGDEGGSDRG